MQITDAQVHIWGANTPQRPWPTGIQVPPQRPVPLTAEQLLLDMDEAGVSRVVLVPPSWEGLRNDLVLAAAANYPDRFAAMGRIDLTQPRSLNDWLSQPGMLGIRTIFLLDWQREQLTSGGAEWVWDEAEAHDIPIMSYAPERSEMLGDIARRHPGMRLIIDHCNLGLEVRDEEIGPELRPVLELAKLDNVAIKVSSLPCYVDEPYPFPSLHAHIKVIVDAFGIERCMWGSDLSRLTCPYRDWVRLFTDELEFLSAEDRSFILEKSIAKWLNWPAGP